MSMFRSAADISDSDPESTSDDFEYEDPSPGRRSSDQSRYAAGERILGSLGSMAGSEPGSYEKAQESEDAAEEDAVLDVDAEGHATLMTSALLEFYCMTRAADILNSQQGSHGRYTRDSPEVQYLGRRMYAYKSQFLSSHGVLANGIDSDDWGLTRQYYRDSLDVLGVNALEGMNLNGPLGPSTKGAITDSAMPSQTQDKQLMASTAAHLQQSTAKEPGAWDMKKRGFRARTPGLVETRISFRGTPQPSPYLLSSSPAGLSLLDSPPPPQSPTRLSRYAVEFAEVRMLGRGSFGEVYHVRNHVDGQNYAIKKIPLSRRRLELLREGGLRQLEHIMKEIRTLARLDHTNVVRYYGAWVEQADGVANPRSLDGARRAEHEPSHTSSDSIESLISSFGGSDDGIVFEEDSKSEATNYKELSFAESSRRRGSHATITSNRSKKSSAYVEEEEEDVESIPRNFDTSSRGLMSTMGGSDGDIFTDGFSEDRSRLQIRPRPRYGSQAPAVILHIQMSLHPISLSTYLNPQSLRVPHGHSEQRRHCFHVIPSLKIILGILSGVEYLHAKGIVHRDLKPANIFLSFPEGKETSECRSCKNERATSTYSCLPRIGDFGLVADISHISDSSPETAVTSLQNNSKQFRHVGTEFYCPPIYPATHKKDNADYLNVNSPEADNPYVIDEKLDVFALGVILFELLYRLNTKMERQFVLADLTRGKSQKGRETGILPSDFSAKVDCGDLVIQNGTSVADALSECIKGMVNPQPRKRWPCKDVRNCLECILSVVEKNLESS
ncbi:hypothetical protein Plec18167_005279 [Paecilomyces lecythidis]|uniref:Protein kinase domain-containing protein n=1 Tax=Paecilomyces lecythidis TaxID=3004212 RepID=A0ABR3XJ77_9EURO